MFRLTNTFVFALLGSASAGPLSLKRSLAAGDHAPIAGFNPLTDVRDQNRIDRDQQLIAELSEAGDFTTAKNVYELGAFSKVVATLTLSEGLPVALDKGAQLHGMVDTATSSQRSSIGDVIVTTYDAYPAGTTDIKVKYHTENCYVGANPAPILTGCLAPSGSLEVQSLENATLAVTLAYSHDPLTTANNYNIKLFTQPTEYLFHEGASFPALYQTFVDYYGSDTFYDDWIQAALSSSATSFANGNADFSSYSDEARAEAVKKASAYGAVWMYVFRELWHAVDLCEKHVCEEESCVNEPAVHEVDEAVAFWTGTLEGIDGSGSGVLAYGLAEKRCPQFTTCGTNGDSEEGNAKANIDVFAVFNDLSQSIVDNRCEDAQTNTDRLIQLAAIPLIQGALTYAYETGKEMDTTDEAEAEGATFAFLVLPIVHACNPEDAVTIYENLKTGQGNTADYEAVKLAFENNYECMGITAADIGEFNEADESEGTESSSTVTETGSSSSGETGSSSSGNTGDSGSTGGSVPLASGAGTLPFAASLSLAIPAFVFML